MGKEEFNLVGVIKANTENFEQGLDKARGKNKRFSKNVNKRNNNLTKSFKKVGSAIAGAFAVKAIGSMITNTAHLNKELVRNSENLGVNVERLQELNYAASQAGVEQDAMRDALKELSMRTDEFVQTASGPAAEAFERLGISTEQLNRVKGNTDKLFSFVANAFSDLNNVAAKQRIADELFGGSAAEQMIAMLSGGIDEINAKAKEAREGGLIVDAEEIRKSAEFNQKIDTLKQTWSSFTTVLVSGATPALTKVANQLGQFIQFVRENQKQIKRWAKTIGTAIMAFAGLKIMQSAVLWVRNLTISFRAMNTAMKANIIFGVASALYTLTQNLNLFKNKANDAKKAQEEYNEVLRETETLSESYQPIEKRMKMVDSLNQRQLKRLKQRIKNQIEAEQDYTVDLKSELKERLSTDQQLNKLREKYKKAADKGMRESYLASLSGQIQKRKEAVAEELDIEYKANKKRIKYLQTSLKVIGKVGTGYDDMAKKVESFEESMVEDTISSIKLIDDAVVPENTKAFIEYKEKIAEAERQFKLFGDESELLNTKQSALKDVIIQLSRQFGSQNPIVSKLISNYSSLNKETAKAASIEELRFRTQNEFLKAGSAYDNLVGRIYQGAGSISSITDEIGRSFTGLADGTTDSFDSMGEAYDDFLERLLTKSISNLILMGLSALTGGMTGVAGIYLSNMLGLNQGGLVPEKANGGLFVGGNSTVGDKVPVLANSGEMILNKHQQANMFRALDHNISSQSGLNNVRFELEGTKLIGVINNVSRKNNKVG